MRFVLKFALFLLFPLLLAVFDEVAKADFERMRPMLALEDRSCALYQPVHTFYCILFTVYCWLFSVYCLLSAVYCSLLLVKAVPGCKIQLRSTFENYLKYTVEEQSWDVQLKIQLRSTFEEYSWEVHLRSIWKIQLKLRCTYVKYSWEVQMLA